MIRELETEALCYWHASRGARRGDNSVASHIGMLILDTLSTTGRERIRGLARRNADLLRHDRLSLFFQTGARQ